MKERLEDYIRDALYELGIDPKLFFAVEFPADMAHGDYATNAAMVAGKLAKKNPKVLAEEMVAKLKTKNDPDIADIAVAGAGFINFKLTEAYFARVLDEAIEKGDKWGWNETLKGKKAIVEYTDPNPFKEFHIGHLMSNAVGESISRLIEASGAETKRACYQGDVGLHVAKAVAHMMYGDKEFSDHQKDIIRSFGWHYVFGSQRYEKDEEFKKQVLDVNKKIYSKSDDAVNAEYEKGRKISLDEFETTYSRLGTKFNFYFFESESGEFGKKIVEENKIFEQSEGAVVFRAEKYDPKLHTRVFINKDGLPTYEAKELGLAKIKYDKFPYDLSIVVTGNEVNDYFQVLLCAMNQVFPELAAKTEHYSHGMLRLPSGKMSSRTGDVITATSLLDEAKDRIKKGVEGVTEEIAEMAAVAAVKYSILRQAAGRDIIFDFDQSLSFEGDSGPYLQYTHARASSVLEKASTYSKGSLWNIAKTPFGNLPRLLVRYPEVVERAAREREPHHVANYLIEIAREFNSFYGNTTILDGGEDEPAKLALTKAVAQTMNNGLWLLGIKAPKEM